MSKAKKYRPGVGILLLNQDNKIFAGKRIDTLDINNSWQMPQGGIDANEDIELAAHRELYEETGVKNVTILKKTDWLYYDLPEHISPKFWNGEYVGQKQIWFKMRFDGNDSEISLDHHEQEFIEWQWTNQEFLLKNIISFKQPLYQKIFSELL